LRSVIPHASPFGFPWLLVDRVVARDAEGAVCERCVVAADAEAPPFLLVECMAQACAAADPAGRPGLLASVRDVRIARAPVPGETLRIEARRAGALGAAVLFDCRIVAGAGEELARGRLAFVLVLE
jgi:predicted hotdog family 3-hydroxylacyl-ACP dehydratase